MFIDTHCHLGSMVRNVNDRTALQSEHFPLLNEIIEEAKRAGVTKIVEIGTSLLESQDCVRIAKKFENVFATVGIHPCDATEFWKQDIQEMSKLVKRKEENKIVGIGEIGLDFYHKPFNRPRQEDAFKMQLELALEHQLPLSLHVRDAGDELLRIVEEYVKDIKAAVIHCFNQKKDFADVVTGWGFFVGIDGPITYPKNEEFRKVVAQIPLEYIVLETDSPFLPPQQYRGKQNRPSYIPLFAQTLADVKEVSLQVLAEKTTANAQRLFAI